MRFLTIMTAFAFLLQAARCNSTKPGSTSDAPNAVSNGPSFTEAKVRQDFAREALGELSGRKNWQTAYVLLSESGMKDRGQHMVLVDAQNQWNYRWWDKPLLNTAKERPLTAAESNSLKQAFSEASSLTDLAEPSFDGVAFEYWVLEHEGDTITAKQRVYMKNPGVADDKRYDKLVMSVLNLQR